MAPTGVRENDCRPGRSHLGSTSCCNSGSCNSISSLPTTAASSRSASSEDLARLAFGGPPREPHRFDLRALVLERSGSTAPLARRYSLGRRAVGSGGYGAVFSAEDRDIPGRKVAVKQIMATDKSKRQAFDNEVAIMKALDHPNVCRILETCASGRVLSIVMEFCAGGDLFDRIAAQGHLSEAAAAGVLRQVALALRYAHGRGVAHRDVKPENICFSSRDSDHVKLVDWGAGCCFRDMSMSRAVGSLAYAAPELAEPAKGYTEACDLWSLGVTAYVALCGKPPFWGPYEKTVKHMLAERYPLKDATWQAISADAKDLVRNLLRARPEARPSADGVLAHPWMARGQREASDLAVARQVVSNVRDFSAASPIFSLFAASVAKLLDHQSLRRIQEVFSDLDSNGDGVLSLSELRQGFEDAFGTDSDESQGLVEVFNQVNMSGSGAISYMEFCAAGIGRSASVAEEALRAAFRQFDVNAEVKKQLAACLPAEACEGSVQEALSQEVGPWLEVASRPRNSGGGLCGRAAPAAGARAGQVVGPSAGSARGSQSFLSRACAVLTRRSKSGEAHTEAVPLHPQLAQVAWGMPAHGLLWAPLALC